MGSTPKQDCKLLLSLEQKTLVEMFKAPGQNCFYRRSLCLMSGLL